MYVYVVIVVVVVNLHKQSNGAFDVELDRTFRLINIPTGILFIYIQHHKIVRLYMKTKAESMGFN